MPDTALELAGFGVATLHEASGRRGLASCLRLLVGEPFAGPAVTVALAAGDNLGVHLAIEAAEPGSVVCIASGGDGTYGVYGDLLHEAARARGVAGLVIDDGIRDLAELQAPPSVASRGVKALGTVKRRLRQPVGADVSLGGILVGPGDWVVVDRDGVFIVASSRLDELLVAAGSRVEKEARLRPALRGGTSSRELLGLPGSTGASVG
jgi:4-hydroxy-4-methyl-2-oxoglutarate aldolase